MIRTIIACTILSYCVCQEATAQLQHEVHGQSTRMVSVKNDKPFDVQKFIGLSLDTTRILCAMIGRVTEEKVGDETHLHAISSDSTVHGSLPSEVNALVGRNGTRELTASFYKLNAEQMKKFSGKEFAGGKLLSFSGELEYPNMFAHITMDSKQGMFSMKCRAK